MPLLRVAHPASRAQDHYDEKHKTNQNRGAGRRTFDVHEHSEQAIADAESQVNSTGGIRFPSELISARRAADARDAHDTARLRGRFRTDAQVHAEGGRRVRGIFLAGE